MRFQTGLVDSFQRPAIVDPLNPSDLCAGFRLHYSRADGSETLTAIAIPSGKPLHSYRKSPFLLGKSTINGPFSIIFNSKL